MTNSFEVETQPTGVSIERTLDVVAKILDDPDFAKEVATHNSWNPDLSKETVALVFLACRFQWAVDLLSRQTATLKKEVEGIANRVPAGE